MRIRLLRLTLLLALAVRAGAADSPAPQPPGTPSANTAEKLVALLDNADFKVRSDAALQLNNLPGDAVGAVEAAMKDGALSPESQIRLEAALKILRPRASREARERRWDEWERRLLHDAYRQLGKTNPAYDRAVDDAIEEWRKLPIQTTQEPEERGTRAAVAKRFKAVIDQGCDDPYVVCLYHTTGGVAFNMREQVPAAERTFPEFLDGPADPCVQLMMIRRAARTLMQAHRKGLAPKMAALVTAAANDPKVPADGLNDLMLGLDYDHSQYFQSMRDFEPAVAAYLKAAPADGFERAFFVGAHQVTCAWLARGNRNEVTPDQQKAFDEKIAEAERTLEGVWKAFPADPRAPAMMISIKHATRGDRAAMETWFTRVIEADPDNYDACVRKLNYLFPGSFGSREEMVAFGRECLKTANWRAGLPFVLVEVHQLISNWSGGKSAAYFQQPEVWKDIQDVYDGCMLNFPNDTVHRNEYVFLALRTKHIKEAMRQIEILGDKSDWWVDPQARSFGRTRIGNQPLTTRPTSRPTTRPTTRAVLRRVTPPATSPAAGR